MFMAQGQYRVAVLGATGLVGKKVLEILVDPQNPFPMREMHAVASIASRGKNIVLNEIKSDICATTLDEINFSEIDLVFNALKSDITKEVMPKLLKSSMVIIDKSSVYRMEESVPLVVARVNDDLLITQKPHLITTPNCCVIPLTHVLCPLIGLYEIRRVVLSTYQSASGAGAMQMQNLQKHSQELSSSPTNLAFNVIPQIGELDVISGDSQEEQKIVQEIRKILKSNIAISVTAVRVPVFIGHSISANIEFYQEANLEKITTALRQFGCKVEEAIITPKEVAGKDDVYVSRLRKDQSLQGKGINLWITSDNLRRGAATNAVEIAHKLAHHKMI
jgi:aspartate-semialdehyde dehydrogenase